MGMARSCITSGSEGRRVSLTTRRIAQMPSSSGMIDAILACAFAISAVAPAGAEMMSHWKWSPSPSGSKLPLPSRSTGCPTFCTMSGPALAKGARFGPATSEEQPATRPVTNKKARKRNCSPLIIDLPEKHGIRQARQPE